MSDLISRSAALNATKMVYIECLIIDEKDYEEGMADDLAVVFASDIKKIPAVDAVPVVHGRWVNYREAVIGLATIWSAECSACGCEQVRKFEQYNYCPNCGAKMYGERKE